ncbi:MAG: roadblock/LC7 domain-containing protein [Polyangiaceae bacterium]
MHWLSDRIVEINALAEEHGSYVGAARNSPAALRGRESLLRSLGRLVEEVASRPGVRASFVSHDGLLLAQAGGAADFEALAALGGQCVRTCSDTARHLDLGGARQVLIVGSERKLALLPMGQMILGILSDEATRLAEVLER